MVPIVPKISLPLRIGVSCPFHLLPGNEEDRFREKLVSPRMVEVEMGIHYVSNVLRLKMNAFQLGKDARFFIPHGRKSLGQTTPAANGVLKCSRVRSGVEEYISPGVEDNKDRDWAQEEFVFRGFGNEDIFSPPNPAATHDMKFHSFFPKEETSMQKLLSNSISKMEHPLFFSVSFHGVYSFTARTCNAGSKAF